MSITDYVIQTAYELEESKRYQRRKQAVYDLLENPHSRIRPYFDIFMMLLVISSVFILLFSVKHHLGAWAGWFENAVLVFFVLEYLGRLWVYDDVHKVVLEEYEKSELINEPYRLSKAFRAVWFWIVQSQRSVETRPVVRLSRTVTATGKSMIMWFWPVMVIRHWHFRMIRLPRSKRFSRRSNTNAILRSCIVTRP